MRPSTPLLLLVSLLVCGPLTGQDARGTDKPKTMRPDVLRRFVDLALACVHRPYPNKIAHVLNGDEDARTPRDLTPVFFGCFDWHSSVHGHWLLVRGLRRHPDAAWAPAARAALRRSFRPENLAGEVRYLNGKGRSGFERPYGLAWLLQLCAELREWEEDAEARRWSAAFRPLETLAADRFRQWLPKLSWPIRTGEHSQTAFALGLVLDWARVAQDRDLARLVEERARAFYGRDRGANLAFEPSGHDFLSPALAEADLMRRLLPPEEFAAWLGAFLPRLGWADEGDLLRPAIPSDRSDGKIVHLDGLNLSRAWMLEGIAAGLPPADPRRAEIARLAALHARAGLDAISSDNYEGGHWLGSFATYLVTRRGIQR